MHEATRRILSVILQRLEGFSEKGNNILICATNRKQDLDAALLSRFDVIVKYSLPDLETRAKIFARYAKHLNQRDLTHLGELTAGLSSRDIKEICQQAERKCAAKLIDSNQTVVKSKSQLPSGNDYIECIVTRKDQQEISNGEKAM
jgi:SpoVK/Ycf46/Vps4 family AAA+-type ATPase